MENSNYMNWKNIQLDEHKKQFYYQGLPLFEHFKFLDALKFHSPGLAPVKDATGWFHINVAGEPIYAKRYLRTFGFYDGLATVVSENDWQIIDTKGNTISTQFFAWCGNFQEELCTVRDKQGRYLHIQKNGNAAYSEKYHYAGDFKYGYACIMNEQQLFTHIDKKGELLHGIFFLDLGVFHKGFAIAKDTNGWFHIDFAGNSIYTHRFAKIEPFYNGWAFVETTEGEKVVVNEAGQIKRLKELNY